MTRWVLTNRTILTLAILALTGCGHDAPSAASRVLLDRELPVSQLEQSQRFDLTAAHSGYRLVEIGQSTVDVQLEMEIDGRRSSYDAPARRFGPERACVFTGAGAFVVRVSTRDSAKDSVNRFRIRVWTVPAAAPAAADSELAAECLEARGGADHEDWNTADPAAQVAAYESAAVVWSRHGRHERASMALLQAAWLALRYLPPSEANRAKSIDLGEGARSGFRALGDCVGVSHVEIFLAVPRGMIAMELDKGADPQQAAAEFAALKRDLRGAIACYERSSERYFAAEAYNSLGAVSHFSGDNAAAFEQLAESAARFSALSELGGASIALMNANIIRSNIGQYAEASQEFEKLLEKGGGAATDEALADILDSSALTHIAVGKYDQALAQLLRASAIHDKAGDLEGVARSHNGFALVYLSIGDAGAARDYAQRAVGVRERLAPQDREATRFEQTRSLLIEGNAQRQLGNLPAAIEAHERALRLTRADALGVRARLELARDRLGQREAAAAMRLLAEAAARVKDTWGTLAPQIELERARAHAQSGGLSSARDVLNKLKGRFAAAGQPTLEIEVLQQLAGTQFALGDRAAARRTGDECLARLEALRLATVNPTFRARLVATHRAAYELEVEMLLAGHARAADRATREKILTEILAASDAARAGLVRELATAAPSVTAAGAEAEARALADEIALTDSLLQQSEFGIALAGGGAPLRERLGDLRARFDSITARRATTDAGFEPTQYSWQNIPADTAVLSFVHSAAGLRRYLFTREGALELPVVATAPVAAALRALLADVTGPRDLETPALAVLSRLLLPSGTPLDGKRRWIIVADATTSAIPFAGLSLATDYRPVILDHELSMTLTTRDALQLARSAEAERRASLGRIAIFADPVFSPLDTRVTPGAASRSRPFLPTPRLAATAKEAQGIAAQLRGADLKVFAGFDASRSAVLSPYVSSATVLHFATHATSSDAWPHGSGLLLSAVRADGELINGYLSTLDLLMNRRSTELVVLSACDTARGESTQTENVSGLARAFLGSGARRVIGTLWAVEDSATALLMSEFYKRLAGGRVAPAALREAQAAMAASDRFHRPAAWSGFVVYERAAVR